MVHPYSSIDTTTAWRKLHFILSVRSDFYMTDTLSIAAHAFAAHAYWCLSWLMRHCFLGRGTCLLVSENYILCGDVTSLIKAHIFRLVCVDMEAYASGCSFQTMYQGFGLRVYICQKRYVIGVVCVSNSMCGVSSASFLCCKHIVPTDDKVAWGLCVSL